MSALCHTLVLGGARSGKSRYAEQLVAASGLDRIYVATAQASDEEMAARIAEHRRRRANHGWRTVEEPFDLPGALVREAAPGRAVLVECLTLWLNNVLLRDQDMDALVDRLVGGLPHLSGPVVFVSNEVGLGIVPETALGRRFRDAQGRMNQSLAAVVPRVVFVAAGLPIALKETP